MKASVSSLVSASMPMVFIKNAWAKKAIGNYPVKGKTVKFGFNVPQTGPYSEEGNEELLAYQLAVKHINSGGGVLETLKPLYLKGNGLLGKKVESVKGNTQTDPSVAIDSARRMIEKEGVIMWSGGISSATAIAQQYLAQQLGTIFMCGQTHSNDTTGKDKRRYGFRHFFNAYITGKALAPVLAKNLGQERRAFHLTSDYTWGHTLYQSMAEFTTREGWITANNIMIPLGTTDYSAYLTAVLGSGADVLVLNQTGKDLINSLTQAVKFGLRELERNGKNLEIVIPLLSRLTAKGTGASYMDGVLGTSNWSSTLKDDGSQAFTQSFIEAYGFPPSQTAQTGYIQTILYANACEKAGTFYPPEVIKALENFRFTGAGSGVSIYRGEDHQCFKDILVMQGNGPDKSDDEYNLLSVVEQVKAADTIYPVDIFPGKLGPYVPN
ncbi:MAG: ABC transporter substrate-binding protein [Aestuariibacter sp.]|nr:ABC transporter substrate-binding protein [Aestuariibacter sp.]